MKHSNQFPSQNTAYSVKVKNGAGWKEYDSARLQISVGQQYHEGEKLKATFNWVSERFNIVTVCVNDTLQRFNHIFAGMAEDEAYEKAEADGREWIERNQHMWRHLPAVKVIRWDTWKNHQDFKKTHDDILVQYERNLSFQQEVDQEINAFWGRKLKSGEVKESDFNQFKKCSKAYLLEEIAVFSIMFKENTAVDIYPGSTLLPCKLNDVNYLGQRGYTRIDFRRNDQVIPQVA